MLKVAPCTVVRSYGRTTKFFRLDGLLLFCIVMGLRSASSAINSKGYRETRVDFCSDMWNLGVIYEKKNICTDNSA